MKIIRNNVPFKKDGPTYYYQYTVQASTIMCGLLPACQLEPLTKVTFKYFTFKFTCGSVVSLQLSLLCLVDETNASVLLTW